MAAGEGKGKADQAGVIAASCCTICCAVCFFLVGIPMLIGGIVCIRIYEGDYDDQVYDEMRDCYIENGYIWGNDQDEVESECGSPQAWEDAKDVVRIVGIVLIIIFVLATIGGIAMILLMCTAVCKSSSTRGTSQPIGMAQTNQGYMYQTQPASSPPQYTDPNQDYPMKA